MLTNSESYTALSDIAIFVNVVKAGSFTAAAEQLNTSKSVISKNLSRLEQRLGAKLLTRTTRRLSLTEAGKVFFEGAQQGLDAITRAEESVFYLQQNPRGTIRINCPQSFGTLHVAPTIAAFIARFPEVGIDLRFDDRKIDMVEEAFDLSIRITRELSGNVVARRLAPCHHAIVASPGYLANNATPQHPRDLSEHPIIGYQYQHAATEWLFVTGQNNEVSVSLHNTIQMNSSLAIREAILANAGIARMPTFVVGEDIKKGRLVQLLPNYRSPELSIFVLYPQRQHLAPKVRAFIDFLVEKFAQTPHWDQF